MAKMRIHKTRLIFWLSMLLVLLLPCEYAYAERRSPSNKSGLSRESFPHGFVFGTATSAFQVEGMTDKDGRGPSIWDTFIKQPGIVVDNSTPAVTVDQYHLYKQDIDLMKDLNFDAYRFSISWSRIFPNGTGEVNWKGVDYYNRLINYMLKSGMDDPGNVTFPKALLDTTRVKYYEGYLSELNKAINEGANVGGYFAWSLLDNFEWRLGFTSRFGIIYVDYKTLKRYPKKSAYWFKGLLNQHSKH
ncbi:Glycoside hydrolase family 1 [Dillenia turbinata]|uniref:Glycoside hydrolase family 1 n=1 Tax=Dillenia turbinata TaxID=194707 RepID=A0AAN8UT28_9MAGN